MPNPVKTALVGYGYAGKTIHAPLIRAVPGLDLTCVVSSRPANVHADLPGVTVVNDVEAMLTDPSIELAVIATPNDLHAPQAHAALAAGKHVVIDKPFCLDTAEAEALIAQAQHTGKLLSVFHCRRWESNFLTLQAVRPQLGELYQVNLRYDRWRPQVRDRWRERAGPGSGIWYDLGSHLLDQSLTLFGWPDWISADIAVQRPGASTDDYFCVTLAYGALRVTLHGGMMVLHPGPAIEAQGSKAAFIKHGMDTQEVMLKEGRTPGSEGWGHDPREAQLVPAAGDAPGSPQGIAMIPGNYLAYYQEMAAAIREGKPAPVTAEAALQVMRLLELGVQSAKDGKRIFL